jgi:hypothetical protein
MIITKVKVVTRGLDVMTCSPYLITTAGELVGIPFPGLLLLCVMHIAGLVSKLLSPLALDEDEPSNLETYD